MKVYYTRMTFLAKVLVSILNLWSRKRLWRKEMGGKNDDNKWRLMRRVFFWGAVSCCRVAVGLPVKHFLGGLFVAFLFSVFVHNHFYFGHDVMKFFFCFFMDNLKFVYIYNHTAHSFMSCSSSLFFFCCSLSKFPIVTYLTLMISLTLCIFES